MRLAASLALRPVRAEDGALLRQIFAATRAAEMALMPLPEAQKQQLLEMQFRAQDAQYHAGFPDASFDLILADGVPVGRLYVDRGEDAIALIDISLLAPYRGRGIGTLLLRALQDEAAAGGRPVSLHVACDNPALRLYQRLGFAVCGDSGAYYSMKWGAAVQPGEQAPRSSLVGKSNFKEHSDGATLYR